jgi:hypothetical protein
MKIVFTFLACCLSAIGAFAQLNTDTAQVIKTKHAIYDDRAKGYDHLHPRFPDIANPTGPGYEVDGTVIRNEAIIKRHITNINDLIR